MVQVDRKGEGHLPHEWMLYSSLICSMETALDLSEPKVIPHVFLVYSKFSTWNTVTIIQYFLKSVKVPPPTYSLVISLKQVQR